MEIPLYFRCPISMEIMEDPVTTCTGVTYDRRSIERWIFECRKSTCPATMQKLENLDLTPNHTLKRLIDSWRRSEEDDSSWSSPALSSGRKPADPREISDLLGSIETSPFKFSALKKLKVVIGLEEENFKLLVDSGGIEILSGILCQTWKENSYENFAGFRSCEESVSLLHSLPFQNLSGSGFQFFTRPDCIKSLISMIQNGSSESRIHSVSILRKVSKNNGMIDWSHIVRHQQHIDVLKALLELLSDEISNAATSAALEILIDVVHVSRSNRVKAIEDGAVCILIELLPESSQGKCEKMMAILKLLCETAEGRSAFMEHAMAVAAVTKKIMTVSETATKLGVKILWLVCGCYPTETFLEEMAEFGAVTKFCGLLQINGGSAARSTRERALKVLKVHRDTWKRYPCFPTTLAQYFQSSPRYR